MPTIETAAHKFIPVEGPLNVTGFIKRDEHGHFVSEGVLVGAKSEEVLTALRNLDITEIRGIYPNGGTINGENNPIIPERHETMELQVMGKHK